MEPFQTLDSLFGINSEQIIIWIFSLFLIFIIGREIITWYWKINKIVDLLEKIEKNTRKESVVLNTNKVEPITDRKGPFT